MSDTAIDVETETSSPITTSAFQRIDNYLRYQDSFHGFASSLTKDLTLVVATEHPVPKTIISFSVSRQHTNRSTNLHGSCIAAIFQISTLTALALVARKDYWADLGAGRSMRVTNLKPTEEGDACWVQSEVVSVGKRMCLIKGTMMRKSDGAIVATCEHERVNLDFGSNSKL